MTKVKLYTGDCLNILAKLKAKSVDCIVTSPPFNIGVKYSQYQDNLTPDTYIIWLYKRMQAMHRVLKDNGSIFINLPANRTELTFRIILRLQKLFKLQNQIAWVKSISVKGISHGHFKPNNSVRFLYSAFEYILHFSKLENIILDKLAIGVPYVDKSNIKRRNHAQDKRDRGNCWFISYKTRQRKLPHPTSFPVKLPQWAIKLHGVKNAVVMDPFMGSGTTGVAAIKCKVKKFIGIELDAAYVAIADKRCQRMLTKKINTGFNK
jgi:site-specific DNA-methyltransferase (adenine-specific)